MTCCGLSVSGLAEAIMPPNDSTDSSEKSILIIDDDREIASMLHGVLQNNVRLLP
jgi:PleD family two-component response regulator